MFDHLIEANSSLNKQLKEFFKDSLDKDLQLIKDLINPQIDYREKKGKNWPSSDEEKKKRFIFEVNI